MLKCPDKECGWFGERCDTAAEFDVDLTHPDKVERNGDAEFSIDISVSFSCPQCSESFDDENLSGGTVFTVEMG